MTDEITFVGTYAIPEGRLDKWRVDMVDAVKASVPRLVSYSVSCEGGPPGPTYVAEPKPRMR